MKIKHNPHFDIEKVKVYYTEKDEVPVDYVCTTDLKASDVPVDVFFRETPHPTFGNRYFGLYSDYTSGHPMICAADIVETLEFGMVENDSGELEYSEFHHHMKMFKNGNMIDGGRQYIRSSGDVVVYRVVDGEFVPAETMGDLENSVLNADI